MKKTLFLSIILLSNWVYAQPKQPEILKKLTPQLLTVPNAIDSNQDGDLSFEEVMAAPESLATLDKNGDGALDWKEMGAWEDLLPLVRAHNVTNFIDSNGDVHLSAEEIKNASTELKKLDKNGDWHIAKKEIRRMAANFPVFSNRLMPYDTWKVFRGYSDKIEGAILPGADKRAFKGYMFIHESADAGFRQQSDQTFLLDETGKRVHEWKHNGHSPEASVAYLLPNGLLLRTYAKKHWINEAHFPVGSASTIELVDWDGKVLWDYTNSVPKKYSFHHDVEYLPNGNILAIRYNGFTLEEAMALGWDSALASRAAKGRNMVWLSSVLELKPNLEDGSTEIVWQWNPWDHLVQNKYPKKSNYGDITDPGKIHLNYLNLGTDIPFNSGQFYHLNTVDYHPEQDLILLSSPTYGELWIIDHSTTIEEAASSTGGKHNKGGDLLYRWGNDESYGKGIRDDSHLYWQHQISWIEEGLPGAGNILIYNNGTRRNLDNKYIKKAYGLGIGTCYTNILEIKPPMNAQGQFDINQPADIVWSWEAEDKASYYSPFMSGAERLPNGNTIFCKAYDKQIMEVTPTGERVMDCTLEGWGELYRIYKFGADYSGLRFKN